MKGLGETIKALRLEKGLTQPQLADLVGVSKGMISIWENNINEPKATYLKALASARDVTVDQLLNDYKNKPFLDLFLFFHYPTLKRLKSFLLCSIIILVKRYYYVS